MSLQVIGNFFKKIGVDIMKVVTYLPTLEVKFSKAVKDAQADTARPSSPESPSSPPLPWLRRTLQP